MCMEDEKEQHVTKGNRDSDLRGKSSDGTENSANQEPVIFSLAQKLRRGGYLCNFLESVFLDL